jgi:hypothetical protein
MIGSLVVIVEERGQIFGFDKRAAIRKRQVKLTSISMKNETDEIRDQCGKMRSRRSGAYHRRNRRGYGPPLIIKIDGSPGFAWNRRHYVRTSVQKVAAGFIPISAKLFHNGLKVVFMPCGIGLKDEHRTSNVQHRTSNNDVAALRNLISLVYFICFFSALRLRSEP